MKQAKNSPIIVPKSIDEYARSKGYILTPDQLNGFNAILSNRPTIIEAAHSVGKSMMAAMLACWFFETHPNAIGMITAPVNRQIGEIIFKEMRRILKNSPYFAPKANSLFRSHDWWVTGIASSSGDAFQGKHSAGGILIIFDECTSVDKVFWERAHTMFESGKKNHYFLGIGNPYTQSSPMYMESQNGKYNVVRMSALTHPNVVNKKEIIPGAISYETVAYRLQKECRIAYDQDMHRAFEFEGKWYVSENPLFDVQILGKYPLQADWSLWSESDLFNLQLPIQDDLSYKVVIGCDVARYGSARSVFCVRRGPNIIHLEAHKGFSIVQTSNKIKEIANKFQTKGFDPTHVPCYIDGTGIGAGVVDLAGTAATKYNFLEVNNSMKPSEDFETYVPNMRSELWINFRDLARKKQVSISYLNRELQLELLKELRLPEFSIDTKGRTVLEPKDKITQRLGMSPDLADAVSLACIIPKKQYESHF